MKRIKKILIYPGIIIGTLVVIWAIIKVFFTPPLLNNISFSRAYYDHNGKLLRLTLANDDKYRIYTPISKISPYIIDAIILYEDKHFYDHIGINPVSLMRALRQYAAGIPHPVGASTITMQVARLKYDIPSKTFWGKTQQIALALYIDLFYSKSEIIEAYLNLAPYGSNIEGIGAASVIYFNKGAKDLTKIESITLATIPQNPVKRGLNTPTGIKNIESMRKNLIKKWIKEYPDDINLLTFSDMPLETKNIQDLPFFAPHFTNYLNTKKIKKSEIHTTLDLTLQTEMEKTITKEIAARKQRGITNAAAILVNYKTMETIAYIGSANYFNRDIYGENDGIRARRSPGSTLKPLIYATATDAGLIHGMTLLRDSRVNFGVYAPENSDNDFYGPILAHDALTHSRNIPAINLVREIGIKNFYKVLSDSGVSNLKPAEHYGVSVALGGAEVSMIELADIYATMANLGTRYTIRTEIDTAKEKIKQLLSPEAFFLTLDMLGHQTAPTKKIPFAKKINNPITHYWKTGTSSSYRDAWTAGIFGDFVLIVWVGNFDGTPNNAFSGAKSAAPIYFSLADTIANYYASIGTPIKNNKFITPELNIISVDMCEIGGGIAGPYCPQKVSSYFIPGKSPLTRNTIHRSIPIDNKTGLRACNADPKTTHNEVFEFWDSEYVDMFNRAGIKRKTPPTFVPNCSQLETNEDWNSPIIVSPIQDTKIVITSNYDFESVGFMAFGTDTNAKLFWFLDDKTLGTTHNGETLEYNVPMGEHILRVTDTFGASSQMNFSIVK